MPADIRVIGDCTQRYSLCVQVKDRPGAAAAIAKEYGFDLEMMKFDTTGTHAWGDVISTPSYEQLLLLLAADPRVTWVEKCGAEKIGPRGKRR